MKNKRKEEITMSNEWKMVRLGDCSKVVMGQSPSSSSYNSDGEGLPFYQGNADFGVINPKVRYYCTEPTKFANVDSVLMSVRAPIGALNIANSYCCIGRGLCAISGIDGVSYFKYLYYYLLKKQAYIQSLGTGSTFKAITGKVVNDLLITLPNIEKQQQIAAVLDKASELVEKRKAQLAELDSLAESIFYDMFGDPVTNEKGWKKERLNTLGKIITGNTPSRQVDLYYSEEHIEWIKTDNISDGVIYPTTAREYLSKEGLAVGRSVNTNSLLITCIAGSIKSIGTVCLTDRIVAFNQQINAFSPNVDLCNHLFMWCLMRFSKKYIQDNATNGMKRIITKSVIENLLFINPPLPLQQQFAQRIEKIEEQKQKVKAALKESEDLFQRLMQDMFNPEHYNS